MASLPLPTPFLTTRLRYKGDPHDYVSVCAGFEVKTWRFERLAAHLTDWLPDFVFRPEDLPEHLDNTSAFRRMMERAVTYLYSEETTASRGELGELLLHVICRQFCDTFPAVSKIFYKTSSNEVVKGFDVAHTRYISGDDEIELWLGEAKFYQDGKSAVAEAVKSLAQHLERGFLTAEKFMVGPKISKETPGYDHVSWLFD